MSTRVTVYPSSHSLIRESLERRADNTTSVCPGRLSSIKGQLLSGTSYPLILMGLQLPRVLALIVLTQRYRPPFTQHRCLR